MSYAFFFLAALAAGLTWAAVFVAAAARVQQGWQTRLLVAAGVLLPLVALLPWVGITGFLAFGVGGPRLEPNWFPHVFTVWVATVVGSIWITLAGLRSGRLADGPRGRTWPLGKLAVAFVASKLAAAGVLMALDQSVVAQANFLRIEAAQLIENNLPPQVSDAENAAPLYIQASANLDSDTDFDAVERLLADDEPGLLDRPEVGAALARHADTLALLEQAAARDVCRFTRDWTRPSFAMLLPEIQAMRRSARLIALAARYDAANGDAAAGLAKVEMIAAFAQHAASEPLLITMLVGLALDAMADETLMHVLPAVTEADDEALANLRLPTVRDTMPRAFFGEEAFGLSTFADVIDGSDDAIGLLLDAGSGQNLGPVLVGKHSPVGMLFRVFLIPSDLAGYRRFLHTYQQQAAGGRSYAALQSTYETLDTELRESSPGILFGLVLPSLNSVLEAGFREEARHAARDILIAATRQRLATGTLPESLEAIDAHWLPLPPGDPFTGERLTDREPLRVRFDEQGLTVWSVGPNGEDDGGPAHDDPDTPRDRNNDDVGLTLPLATSGG
jgi:hypothetical protein